jgi:adsorption protein B
MGHRGRFVRVRASDGRLIASRGCFPGQFLASARQKARWIRGIALEGWDRLGWPRDGQCRWPGDLAAWWMVWRDRRAPLAAAVSVLAYAALLLLATHRLIGSPIALPRGMAWLLTATAALAVWRVLVRAWATASLYGWRQALPSIPRVLVANIILCAAAAMAVYDYMAGRFGRALVWNKTEHRFPT